MPPIVLAIKSEGLHNILNPKNVTEDQIIHMFKAENLIILDGLQRTYTLIDVEEELRKRDPHSIRLTHVYVA
jgi:uncharacterized membrane protein YukC